MLHDNNKFKIIFMFVLLFCFGFGMYDILFGEDEQQSYWAVFASAVAITFLAHDIKYPTKK